MEQELLASCSYLDSDIHTLAYFYHWDYFTCLKMTVRRRRTFVEYIREQKRAEARELESAIGDKPSESTMKYREGD